MIVRFSDEAEIDFERIGDYIAQDNPRRAVSFVRELRERCISLSNFPLAYPVVQGYPMRRMVHGSYSIFYLAEPEYVFIVHVLNSAQDYGSIL